jgi:hypothetical protein
MPAEEPGDRMFIHRNGTVAPAGLLSQETVVRRGYDDIPLLSNNTLRQSHAGGMVPAIVGWQGRNRRPRGLARWGLSSREL